ncbi:SLA class II histocompatibility antigen, DQ haplotype D alpha chain-like [Engraulis encrasicolus]|uniref:SLA class II histocompatibility antigen, DQ haplotype D alpha chain-like n=1 Tax=Engraulis encrasicolus TaxID=184585 RepID=UPI002FD341A6
MKMALTEILLVLTGIICAETKLVHVDLAVTGCSSCDGEDMKGLDGEEMAHADWQAKKYVMTLPEFVDPFTYSEGTYEAAVAQQQICKANLETVIKAYRHPAVAEAPPMSSIYPRDDVQLGTANTLICLIQGFYPPHINVTWTRNDKPVTAGVSTSQLRMNVNDGTYSQFSTLQFTPEEGDIYTCTVEHSALDRPLTREFAAPVVNLRLGKASVGGQPAILVCSAYDFYPKMIKLTWYRDGKEVTGDVISSEELADGDWYYQIHSHLEFTPKAGEKISCMVEHSSLKEPLVLQWDPPMPRTERAKIAVGVAALVLGFIVMVAGFIYYERSCRVSGAKMKKKPVLWGLDVDTAHKGMKSALWWLNSVTMPCDDTPVKTPAKLCQEY